MRGNAIVDLRNIFDPAAVEKAVDLPKYRRAGQFNRFLIFRQT